MPKKGRTSDALGGEPKLPVELEGALHSLYGNYEKYYRLWEQNADARARGITPPVFVVVCNNTNVSKMVFDYIGGWEKQIRNSEEDDYYLAVWLATIVNSLSPNYEFYRLKAIDKAKLQLLKQKPERQGPVSCPPQRPAEIRCVHWRNQLR